MRLISTNNKKRPFKALWSVLLAFLVVFGQFSGFLTKSALATNNFVSNITFTSDSNSYLILTFHVDTTFTNTSGDVWANCEIYHPTIGNPGGIFDFFFWPTSGGSSPFTYTAGNTYSNFIYSGGNLYEKLTTDYNGPFISTDYLKEIGNIFGEGSYQSISPHFLDTDQHVYFQETPTLTITYPLDNYELLTNFYITGSFTQPTSTYQFLMAIFNPVGWAYTDIFDQAIYGNSTGTIAIWVSGLAKGYYDFEIYMMDNEGKAITYPGWDIDNIHIVDDLPWTLPPVGEQPPSTAPPVYQTLVCGTYYLSNSTYETSTALWNTICDTFSPVLLAIGGNLTEFASRFTPSNASSTGNQLGASILLIRSYVSNINSFFADFPVGQFLLLYLIALVVIIVLRLVKGLINLFKI